MNKEELERIKQAYNSGLKVQIWFNGYWEDFDIRDYSMYSEPFSEHRQYRIVGSAYADIAEKRIEQLEKENAELRYQLNKNPCVRKEYYCSDCLKDIEKAKEIIKSLCKMVRALNNPNVQLTNVDYSLSEAEQFIKDSEGK